MVKVRTTRKSIMEDVEFSFTCGYCWLQKMLSGIEPVAYITDRYSWRCDVYSLPDVNWVLTTGYQPAGKYHLSYDECKKLEEKYGRLDCLGRKTVLKDILYHKVEEIIAKGKEEI